MAFLSTFVWFSDTQCVLADYHEYIRFVFVMKLPVIIRSISRVMLTS